MAVPATSVVVGFGFVGRNGDNPFSGFAWTPSVMTATMSLHGIERGASHATAMQVTMIGGAASDIYRCFLAACASSAFGDGYSSM